MVNDVPQEPISATAGALHSAALRLLRLARTADTGMNLDGPRASALSVLVFRGPVPLTKLAKLEQVSPPAMTKTVDVLESDGLALRTRSTSDRRVVLVGATDAGRALLERGRSARVQLVAELLTALSEHELGTVGEAANLIAGLLDPRPDAAGKRSVSPPAPVFRQAVPVLRVDRSAAAERFYCAGLGFSVEYRSRPAGTDPCYLGLVRDGARLHLSSFPGDGVVGNSVYLRVDDVDAVHEALIERAVQIATGPVDKDWGNREMYVEDPDGNSIRFIQPRT